MNRISGAEQRDMSVFASSDERIFIEEIVEATTGENEHETDFCRYVNVPKLSCCRSN